jgi:hypothetical protein
MKSENYLNDINRTGDFLINESRKLVLEVKQNGKKTSKKTIRKWIELRGRMNQWENDVKKLINEGEEWKNEK